MKKTVIYIVGAGRSGTTLLDIILGNGAGITSCGELMRFVETRAEPPGYGPETENYKYWQDIGERLGRKYGGKFDYDEMQNTCRKVEYHRWYPRTYLGMVPDHLASRYIEYNTRLYESIFETIDTPMIVDSSKWPGRAAAMYHYMKDYEFRYVYLVRHPVSVVRSFAKQGLEQGPKSFLSANLYYFLVNFACARLLKKIRRAPVSVICYENLLSEPARELARMGRELDIDLTQAIDLISNGRGLKIARLFEGNRIRMKDSLVLRSDIRAPGASGRDRITRLLNLRWWKRCAGQPG